MTSTPRREPTVDRGSIIGRRILRIAQTEWSEPVCHHEGLGDAFYCTVVLELEGAGMFVLADESIGPWDSREALTDAKLEEHRIETSKSPLGQAVAAVWVDQLGEISVVLENGVFLSITSGYGWYLWIGNFEDLRREKIDGDPISFVDWWSGDALREGGEP
jgi:hypothetical protein